MVAVAEAVWLPEGVVEKTSMVTGPVVMLKALLTTVIFPSVASVAVNV